MIPDCDHIWVRSPSHDGASVLRYRCSECPADGHRNSFGAIRAYTTPQLFAREVTVRASQRAPRVVGDGTFRDAMQELPTRWQEPRP